MISVKLTLCDSILEISEVLTTAAVVESDCDRLLKIEATLVITASALRACDIVLIPLKTLCTLVPVAMNCINVLSIPLTLAVNALIDKL